MVSQQSLEGIVLDMSLKLAETKTIRNRTVYNVLTMISEVSGIADLLMVFTSLILGTLYTPFML